jgi:hypothetical protein
MLAQSSASHGTMLRIPVPEDTLCDDGGEVKDPLKNMNRYCPAFPGGRFADVGVAPAQEPAMYSGPPATPLVPFM